MESEEKLYQKITLKGTRTTAIICRNNVDPLAPAIHDW
jgi:hypothetical protein